jgi:hypothetical protein
MVATPTLEPLAVYTEAAVLARLLAVSAAIRCRSVPVLSTLLMFSTACCPALVAPVRASWITDCARPIVPQETAHVAEHVTILNCGEHRRRAS